MKLKDLIGLPIGKHFVVISEKKALDKRSGKIIDIVDINDNGTIISLKSDVERIDGLTTTVVDLSLFGREEVPVNDGFLIEVYESGSDGKLTRVYRDDVVDPFTGDVVREGFKHYLKLVAK